MAAPARILLKVNQVNSLKGNKNTLNCETVWEILLTHCLAVAEVGRGRGCVTPSPNPVQSCGAYLQQC